MITGSELKSVIDKNWTEGSEYDKVEFGVICHDGESVQGSHVAQNSGVYILQWKYNPNIVSQLSHDSSGSGDVSRSSSSHKAQIMYFYEILPSANYK